MNTNSGMRELLTDLIRPAEVGETTERLLLASDEDSSSVLTLFLACPTQSKMRFAHLCLMEGICEAYVLFREGDSSRVARTITAELIREVSIGGALEGRLDVNLLIERVSNWISSQVNVLLRHDPLESLPLDLLLCLRVATHSTELDHQWIDRDRLYLSYYVKMYVMKQPLRAIYSKRLQSLEKSEPALRISGTLSLKEASQALDVKEDVIARMLNCQEVDPSDINRLARYTNFRYPSQQSRAWLPSHASYLPAVATSGTPPGLNVTCLEEYKKKVKKRSVRKLKDND